MTADESIVHFTSSILTITPIDFMTISLVT